MMDSDSSDLDDVTTRRDRVSDTLPSTSTSTPTSDRLEQAIARARSRIGSCGAGDAFAHELGQRFPFLGPRTSVTGTSTSQGPKRRKLPEWSVTPCCLRGPQTQTSVPSQLAMDELCKVGLGTRWFSREDRLKLPLYLTAEEIHFVMTCLYPKLQNAPYEFCKATGPGNKVIVALPIARISKRPSIHKPFAPYFSVRDLKENIGRKGRLYIRPLQGLDTRQSVRLSAVEV